MSKRLFTVGPVEVMEDVRQVMARPMITHRCKEYRQLHEGIVEKMRKVLDTDMDILLVGGSASVFLEACIRNGVSRKNLGASNGSFGNRWQEISALNGKDVKKIQVPWGEPIRAQDLDGQVGSDIEAVTVVSNESSTGVLNPLPEIVDSVRSQGDALLFVDAVTSATAVDLELRRLDLDAVVFGSQKALSLPPGLAFLACSERLLEKAKTVQNRGFYTDILELKKKNDENYALTTPPVSLMYGLDYQLDRIMAEGTAARYRRHEEMAKLLEDWAAKRDGIYPLEGFRSRTIAVINKGSMPYDQFSAGLKAKGFEVSNGYGKIKDSTFRVGCMGDLTVKDIKDLIQAMDTTLEELK
ncbi:MAG: aminotransferase class V-fold PLP-dependent enzyme [Candidatus Methanomethylophilaceae archaeon]|nr:aminotransferase class V-fold PLP-dependent enzyme [Candidatus Methanomethylophilaceae archaeon]